MSTPIVTEITFRPDPVVHDTFVDDLGAVRGADHEADSRRQPRLGVVESVRVLDEVETVAY